MTDKKIITVFVHCYPPAKGGLEYLIGEVKKALSMSFKVHIITGQGLSLDSYKTFSNFTEIQTPTIHRLKLNFTFQRLANKFLNKIIFKIPFFSPFYFGPLLKYPPEVISLIKQSDFIIGAGLPTMSVLDAYFFARLYHKDLITIPAFHQKNYYQNCYFFQKVLQYSKIILCLSLKEKHDLEDSYSLSRGKISILPYSPFSFRQISHQKHKNLVKTKMFHLTNRNITIGYVGQITLRKNLEFIKQLFDKYYALWLKNNLSVNLLFAGAKTNSSDAIETLFKPYLDSGLLKIIYNFSDDEKPNIFSQIDLFVMPSIEESLGIVNFEAIYYSTPIMVHQKSAFADLLSNQLNYFDNIQQVNQNILHFIDNPLDIKKTVDTQYKVFISYNFDIFKKTLIHLN